MRYPTFHRAEGTPKVVWESGQCASILWPAHEDGSGGPGIRWGNWRFWDGSSFNVPPDAVGLGYCSTILDAIAWRRAVLQGVSPLAGGVTGTDAGAVIPPLTTELAARYTPFQGRSFAQVDQASWAFPFVPGDGRIKVLLGDTYGELPPIAMLMARRRDPETYAPTGEPWGGVYDLTKEPRDVVSPGPAPLVLATQLGATLSEAIPAPRGWNIQRYSLAVGNDEGTSWQIRAAGREIARVRPWHGFFGIWSKSTGPSSFVALSLSRSFAHVLGRAAEDGSLILARADNAAPTDFAAHEYPTSLVPDSLRLDHSRGGEGDPVWLAYVTDGTARIGRCALGGEPEEVTTLGSGSHAALCWSANNVLHAYRLDDGAVYVRRYDLRGNAIGGESATGISGLDDAPIDCRATVSSGTLVVTLAAISGGEAVVFRSDGGVTFS